jgi:hypothetical protein
MFQLELDDQERRVLSEALQSFLSELRTEVSHTDRQAYRQALKDQEHVIKAVVAKLGGA